MAANHADCFDHIVVALAASEARNADRDDEFAQLLSEGRRTDAWTVMVNSLYPSVRPSSLARLGGGLLSRVAARAEHEYAQHDVMDEAEAEVAFDSRSVLPTIEVPVLLLNRSEDDHFPMDPIAETAELIPDCTSKVYEGKSRVRAAVDSRLAQDIREFVTRSDGASGE